MFLLREGVVIKHYIDDTLFFAYPNVCCRMEIYRARNLTNNPREISFWCSKSFGGQQAFVTHHIAAVSPMKNSSQLPVVSHDDKRIPV